MRSHRAAVAVLAVVASACTPTCGGPTASTSPAAIIGHPVRVDADRKLLSWSTAESPYATVAKLAFTALETKFRPPPNTPPDERLETWLGYSRFDPDTFEGIAWPHNPAGLYAMITESAVLWYAFSGDRAAIDLTRPALDYQLAHGTTPHDWDWAAVPYASAGAGDAEYGGADDAWCDSCGRGDGTGVIEPDKAGELGFAYLQMFEVTGDARYRDAAITCADALAKHVRAGDEARSPWPFRVYAQTNVVREEYSSNVVGALTLFDELDRLGLGDVDAYANARALAFDWLLRVPMTNDAWSGYFEDIGIQPGPSANPNQYSALRTARWLMAHRDADAQWQSHVAHLLAWADRVFGVDTKTERGRQWSATVMSEQAADMAKMGSHTARFGAVSALWFEATGDARARDLAARSLNWATYACREDGIVSVGQDANEGFWFSDGYGDYIRQFLIGMAAVPDWAPAHETHLLRSTSTVTRIAYRPARGVWTTFDLDATETLRLASKPAAVVAGGVPLAQRATLASPGYTLRTLSTGGLLLRVRHDAPGEVVVTTDDAAGAAAPTPPEGEAVVASGSGAFGRTAWEVGLGLGVVLAVAACGRAKAGARGRPRWFSRRGG